MFCPECGAEIDQNAKFCTNCGRSMERNEDADNRLEEQYAYLTLKKRQQDKVLEMQDEIKHIKKEIEELLKIIQLKKQTEHMQKQKDQKESEKIEYCPYCGFHVGEAYFCGKCGKRVRG